MEKEEQEESKSILKDYGIAIGAAVLIALFIRFFLVEAYRMPSGAMAPTLEPGDTLFVSKLSYGIRLPGDDGERLLESKPKIGDVVVFEFPDEPKREYIKRVVGLAGDRIKIESGKLYRNGTLISEFSNPNDLCGKEPKTNGEKYVVCIEQPLMDTTAESVVPENQVFLVGDYRSVPAEPRRLKLFGMTPIAKIKGKAKFVWISIFPTAGAGGGDWFSRIRFDRILKAIH